jgi:acyl-CoA synthetase (AMP-forming)/AMP-acid ligase II
MAPKDFWAMSVTPIRPSSNAVYRAITALPLYHIFALMVNFITYYSIGAENWLVPNPREMDNFIEILRKAHCTVFTGVNTLFCWATDAPKDWGSGLLQAALSSVLFVLLAGRRRVGCGLRCRVFIRAQEKRLQRRHDHQQDDRPDEHAAADDRCQRPLHLAANARRHRRR